MIALMALPLLPVTASIRAMNSLPAESRKSRGDSSALSGGSGGSSDCGDGVALMAAACGRGVSSFLNRPDSAADGEQAAVSGCFVACTSDNCERLSNLVGEMA